MLVINKSINRLKNYLDRNKIKNIIFISHTKLAAKEYLKCIKDIVNLDKYNIEIVGNSEKSIDKLLGYESNSTIAIMCGIWYKSSIVQYDPFWGLINNIYTIPVDEMPVIQPNKTNSIKVNVSLNIDEDEIELIANEAKEKLINSLKNNIRLKRI